MPLIIYDRCESKLGKSMPRKMNNKVDEWDDLRKGVSRKRCLVNRRQTLVNSEFKE